MTMTTKLLYPTSSVWKARISELLVSILLFPCLLAYRKRPIGPKTKVLFVEPFGFGDVVSLSAAFDPILSLFPSAEIHILTQLRNADIYSEDSRVTETHCAPIPWAGQYHEKKRSFSAWAHMLGVVGSLRKKRFDVAIDPRGDVRSQLLMVLCGAHTRVGFTNYLINSNIAICGLLLNKNYGRMNNLHRFEINRLLAEFALETTLPKLGIPCFKPAADRGSCIVVHPFGGWDGKLWSLDQWAELLGSIEGYDIILCGTKAEESTLRALSDAVGGEFRITTVSELIHLLRTARMFIGLDSDPMNLAAAMGVPVVALFGPGDSERWRPLSVGSQYIHHVLDCTPCVQKECLRPADSCMNKISLGEVRAAVLEVLG